MNQFLIGRDDPTQGWRLDSIQLRLMHIIARSDRNVEDVPALARWRIHALTKESGVWGLTYNETLTFSEAAADRGGFTTFTQSSRWCRCGSGVKHGLHLLTI